MLPYILALLDQYQKVIETKKLADGIKASVAAKEEYNAANDMLINADASAARMEWENAYKGYETADKAMAVVYETVSVKRAAAEKAMAEAKARAEAAAAYAEEADTIAPLAEEWEIIKEEFNHKKRLKSIWKVIKTIGLKIAEILGARFLV